MRFNWQAVFGWAWRLKTSLRAARRIAINAGLRYVYTGNIHDPAGQSTSSEALQAVPVGDKDHAGVPAALLGCPWPLPSAARPR